MFSRCLLLLAVAGFALGCASSSSEPTEATPPAGPGAQAAARDGAPDYPDPPGLEGLTTMEELEKAPTYTPYQVKPDVLNRRRIARALEDSYPPDLKRDGVGGVATIWLLIDREGSVRKVQIRESSGHPAIDSAALSVAAMMEFSPALKDGEAVPVWISIPVTYTVRR
jgi:protein TonB